MRTLVLVNKTSIAKTGLGDSSEVTSSYYLSSLQPGPAAPFARLVRGHWGGCEIRNHWVRDAIFEEDGTRSKNLNLNGNLAVLRSAIIALKARLCPEHSWSWLQELSTIKTSVPYSMIAHERFK